VKKLEKILLGKTGLDVSKVAMGGIPIQRPSLEEAVKIINRALDLGVNLIDTSIGYGNSEVIIGKGIKGRRDEVLIATKGSWRNKETSLAHIDYSLQRLGTDYIDLWQI
jgi:aryl-alcohol dehydrogenase-like predicted oxidoreductase